MRRSCCLLLLFVITLSALSAQNQINMMTTIYGEFNGDEFRATMVSMDYDGDKYDNLIVVAIFWNATNGLGAYYPGNLYYMGDDAALARYLEPFFNKARYPLPSSLDIYKSTNLNTPWLMDPKKDHIPFWLGLSSNKLLRFASIYGCQVFESDYVGIFGD